MLGLRAAVCLSIGAAVFGMSSACGSSPSTSDAGGCDASCDDSSITPDAMPMDVFQGAMCGSNTSTLTLTATADTSLTDFCAGTICYGGVDFGQVGEFSANAPPQAASLIRFDVSPAQQAIVFGSKVAGATLVLHARPNCSQCGANGAPARAGALVVYPMRSDWDELYPSATMCAADRCHRTGGANALGWGPNRPADTTTKIAVGDYGPASVMQPFADGAMSVEIPIPAGFLGSYGASTAGKVSFFLDAPTGLFIFASREAPSGVSELRVAYCP